MQCLKPHVLNKKTQTNVYRLTQRPFTATKTKQQWLCWKQMLTSEGVSTLTSDSRVWDGGSLAHSTLPSMVARRGSDTQKYIRISSRSNPQRQLVTPINRGILSTNKTTNQWRSRLLVWSAVSVQSGWSGIFRSTVENPNSVEL